MSSVRRRQFNQIVRHIRKREVPPVLKHFLAHVKKIPERSLLRIHTEARAAARRELANPPGMVPFGKLRFTSD